MSGMAIAMCVAGALVVTGGLVAADRYPEHAAFAVMGGAILMWTAFWVEVVT